MKMSSIFKGVAILVGLFILIQLIPYGKDHANPPFANEPAWTNPQTRALAKRACFDCHSNETVWPWYSNIAPISWLIQHDVQEGRQVVNFSEWNTRTTNSRGFSRLNEVSEVILRNSMPPFYYVLIHADAGLTTTEKDQLILGLQSILASSN